MQELSVNQKEAETENGGRILFRHLRDSISGRGRFQRLSHIPAMCFLRHFCVLPVNSHSHPLPLQLILVSVTCSLRVRTNTNLIQYFPHSPGCISIAASVPAQLGCPPMGEVTRLGNQFRNCSYFLPTQCAFFRGRYPFVPRQNVLLKDT